MQEKIKKIVGITVSLVLLSLIVFYIYKLNYGITESYISSKDNINMVQGENLNTNNSANTTGFVQEGIPFTSRSVSGGGENPGWLISISETQPKVFTGKLFTKEGVEAYDLFMQEENNFFAGEAKNIKNKENIQAITLQKTDEVCLDTEKNSFEYKIAITFIGETLSGCGGKVK